MYSLGVAQQQGLTRGGHTALGLIEGILNYRLDCGE